MSKKKPNMQTHISKWDQPINQEKVQFVLEDDKRNCIGYYKEAEPNEDDILGHFIETVSGKKYAVYHPHSSKLNEVTIWMNKVKKAAQLGVAIFIMSSIGCSSPHKIKDNDIVSKWTVSYGNEHLHECKDLLDVVYGVTKKGDTVQLKVIQRKCPKYGTNRKPEQ